MLQNMWRNIDDTERQLYVRLVQEGKKRPLESDQSDVQAKRLRLTSPKTEGVSRVLPATKIPATNAPLIDMGTADCVVKKNSVECDREAVSAFADSVAREQLPVEQTTFEPQVASKVEDAEATMPEQVAAVPEQVPVECAVPEQVPAEAAVPEQQAVEEQGPAQKTVSSYLK